MQHLSNITYISSEDARVICARYKETRSWWPSNSSSTLLSCLVSPDWTEEKKADLIRTFLADSKHVGKKLHSCLLEWVKEKNQEQLVSLQAFGTTPSFYVTWTSHTNQNQNQNPLWYLALVNIEKGHVEETLSGSMEHIFSCLLSSFRFSFCCQETTDQETLVRIRCLLLDKRGK